MMFFQERKVNLPLGLIWSHLLYLYAYTCIQFSVSDNRYLNQLTDNLDLYEL